MLSSSEHLDSNRKGVVFCCLPTISFPFKKTARNLWAIIKHKLLSSFFLSFCLILPEWAWTWPTSSFPLSFSNRISGTVLLLLVYFGGAGGCLSCFSMNFHWISVPDGIYSLENSMHSLLRLNEKTFNAIISQQRTFISVSPSGLSPCGRMCLPGLGSVRQPRWSLSRQCFPKAALCCCLSLCWYCCVSERAGECSNSVFPLAGCC